MREQLASSPWIPDSVRPSMPPPPPPPYIVAPPSSAYERVQDWVSRHKLLTGVVVLVAGGIVYRSYRKTKFCRKTRRARRARNGARTEVVVVAGSPTVPLTRAISLELGREGFVE